MMRKAFLLASAIIGLFLASCATGGTQAMGTLEGKVTIGPLSPVQREGEIEVVPPEVYAARKVLVYDKRGSKLLETIDLGTDGSYRVSLKPGVYTIDINHLGIDSSSEVPRQIEIKANEIVTLNIDIDTGIR